MLCALLCSCAPGERGSLTSVDVEGFAQALGEKGVQVLDVRTADEYARGHLPNAVNIDVRGDDFAEVCRARLVKGQTVAVYCRSGKRSKLAGKILADLGYRVVEMDGGITSWPGTLKYGND